MVQYRRNRWSGNILQEKTFSQDKSVRNSVKNWKARIDFLHRGSCSNEICGIYSILHTVLGHFKGQKRPLESFKPDWVELNCLFLTFFWQNYDYFVEDEEARIREMEVMDRLLEVISLEK